MELIDNVNKTLRDDLSVEIKSDSRVSIAAACFSIYAFEELKKQLKGIDELQFIFTSPTFLKEHSSSMIHQILVRFPRGTYLYLNVRVLQILIMQLAIMKYLNSLILFHYACILLHNIFLIVRKRSMRGYMESEKIIKV